MNSETRIRAAWPGWLVWALPASIGLIVIGYLTISQAASDSARSAGVFWGEVLVFGIIGPWRPGCCCASLRWMPMRAVLPPHRSSLLPPRSDIAHTR